MRTVSTLALGAVLAAGLATGAMAQGVNNTGYDRCGNYYGHGGCSYYYGHQAYTGDSRYNPGYGYRYGYGHGSSYNPAWGYYNGYNYYGYGR